MPSKEMVLPFQSISIPCCCRAKNMTKAAIAMAQENAVEVMLRGLSVWSSQSSVAEAAH